MTAKSKRADAKLLDLFSGIGGMSLGLERAGATTIGFCEIGKNQQKVLNRHWPGVPVYNDITNIPEILTRIDYPVDIIAGGDPCPIRSRARINGESRSPDLSGYFLALVGNLRPRWVVRENVLASDDIDFATALGVLGYRTVIIRTNAATLTGQNRARDFIVGQYKATWESFESFLSEFQSYTGNRKTNFKTRQVIPCLVANRTRYDSRDCYIFDQQGFRILDFQEREKFAGFPSGWLEGFSEAACALMFGNAVVPGIAEAIGRTIMKHSLH